MHFLSFWSILLTDGVLVPRVRPPRARYDELTKHDEQLKDRLEDKREEIVAMKDNWCARNMCTHIINSIADRKDCVLKLAATVAAVGERLCVATS